MSATFKSFDESTKNDWDIVVPQYVEHERKVADRVLAGLERLRGITMGCCIDRYEHSLQAATRAYRDDADEETIVCALLHDIGDDLGTFNHGELAAAILRPYISENNAWMLEHHEIFQRYHWVHLVGQDRNQRDKFRDHPAFDQTAHFCAMYDQAAFDPDYDTLDIAFFEPMVRRIFERKPKTV